MDEYDEEPSRFQSVPKEKSLSNLEFNESHQRIINILSEYLSIKDIELNNEINDNVTFKKLFIDFLDKPEEKLNRLIIQHKNDKIVNSHVKFDIKVQSAAQNPEQMIKILKKENKEKNKICVSTEVFSEGFLSAGVIYKFNEQGTDDDIANKFELGFSRIDVDTNYLVELEKIIRTVFIPAIEAFNCDDTNLTKEEKCSYIDNLNDFVRRINSSSGCINQMITIENCPIFHGRVWDFEALKYASTNLEMLGAFEECAAKWMRKIKTEIQESDMLYIEDGLPGPNTEIRYWKSRMCRYNYLVNQLRSKHIQDVLTVLKLSNSKTLEVWLELDKQITHSYTEARENCKFLQKIEDFCLPLYQRNIVEMINGIPHLLSLLRLIYTHSTFYKTFYNMTILFSKLTNQIITSCMLYITNNNSESIWSQTPDIVIKKMRECDELRRVFIESYRDTKNKMDEEKDNQVFGFSEIQIFGSLTHFCNRLRDIISILSSIKTYKSLHDVILEGKDKILENFGEIIFEIHRKPYNILDPSNSQFDDDFKDFKESLERIHTQVFELTARLFQNCRSVLSSLKVQKKIRNLIIPNLNHQDRIRQLLGAFKLEIEEIGALYMNQRDNPPIERNMPPYIGNILWSRQLYQKLEEPMNLLHELNMSLFITKDGQKVISRYNRVVQTLVTYEILNYRSWRKMTKFRIQGFNATPLVIMKSDRYPNLYVNMDPDILTLFREIRCMEKSMCPIPYTLKHIRLLAPTTTAYMIKLQYLCDQYANMTKSILPEYDKLLPVKFHHFQAALQPGLTILDWYSANIISFIEDNLINVEEWMVKIKKISHLREFSIEQRYREISQQSFIDLNEYNDAEPGGTTTYTLVEFINAVYVSAKRASLNINSLTNLILDSTQQLVSLLLEEYDEFVRGSDQYDVASDETTMALSIRLTSTKQKDRLPTNEIMKTRRICQKILQAAEDLVKTFGQKAVETIVKTVRNSLDEFWKVLSVKEAINELKRHPESDWVYANKILARPIFQAEIRLSGTKFVMKPTIDEIQSVIKKVVLFIESTTKSICKWVDFGRRKTVTGKKSAYERKKSTDSATIQKASQAAVSISTQRNDSITSEDHSKANLSEKGVGYSYTQGSNLLEKDDQQFELLENNCFSDIRGDREIYRIHSFLVTWSSNINHILFDSTNNTIQEIPSIFSLVQSYEFFFAKEPIKIVNEFIELEPSLFEYQTRISELVGYEEELNDMKDFYVIGPIELNLIYFKSIVAQAITHFKTLYMKACLRAYVSEIQKIKLLQDIDRIFKKPLRTLDDISVAMETKRLLFENEIDIDLKIIAAEEAASVLSQYNLPLPRDLLDQVESTRSYFNKIQEKSKTIMTTILSIQHRYKQNLIFNTGILVKDIKEFECAYDERGPLVPGLTPREALDRHIFFKNRCENLSKKAESYNKGEKLFGIPLTDRSALERINKELEMLHKLYGLYDEVNKAIQRYHEISWRQVNTEEIGSELREFQLKCKRLPRGLKQWPAFQELLATIEIFCVQLPLIELMTHPAMKPRHWNKLSELLQYEFPGSETDKFTLENIIKAPLLIYQDTVEDVCIGAQRERDIETKLNAVINDWVHQELKFTTFKQRGFLLLKGDRCIELLGTLEDSLMVIGSLNSNRYNVPFRNGIQDWLQKLTTTSEVIDVWMRVQNLWLYLEAVFVGGDIAKQLPMEARRFQSIDKTWTKIMERAYEIQNVIQCCTSDQSLLEILPRLMDQLELCQKSLTGYLENKRSCFPRFFFVSDPVLLEILGKSSDSHSIQPYLLSVFDNSKTAQFHTKFYDIIEGVYSSENEYLQFEKVVRCEGHVETWLYSLLREIQNSVFQTIRTSYFQIVEEECELIKYLRNTLAQVGILAMQLIWTMEAGEALKQSKTDQKIMYKTHRQFVTMLNLMIAETAKELTPYDRTKFETLITIHVHQRDIFEELYRSGIRTTNDFDWQKQTRVYFLDEMGKCVISLTDVNFEYQNEFLGCTERLVITPLTDKCYITLAQAVNMGLGGAPTGPAGTGKTETTKDMGRCLGKYVVVFNCSDQMDFRGLGRIFKGLAQSGTWGCFDEFNRINLPVLSVAAQQIAIILQCKRENKTKFVFSDGDVVEMNYEFGMFLTMNPGYAGRQELPENLKINFRCVAMMVPDRQIIIRVKLAACGFVENIVLARKFFVLYKLCEEQLSKQVHYDFGLRNILSVLRTLGSARRASHSSSAANTDSNYEERTVMRVLRDMNMSKLVDKDEPLFLSLVNDLFPGLGLDKASHPPLDNAIRKTLDSLKLVYHPPWVLKIVQLYETQLVRHGIMTLGPTGTGKSTSITVLQNSLSILGLSHREVRMNPKAITASEMFGKLDASTNDWTDGIFSVLWRRTVSNYKRREYVWLVLDGPVDALWIENLNSVLDDNRTLTLANGDRIPMSTNCKLIFEVDNIDNASPATVSRNGMVFMSSSGLNWRPIFKAWLSQQDTAHKQVWLTKLDLIFDHIYKFVSETLSMKIHILECSIINQICCILSGLVSQCKQDPTMISTPESEMSLDVPTYHKDSQLTESVINRCIVFAVLWAFGAVLEMSDREKLDLLIRTEFATILKLPPLGKDKNDVTCFDFFITNQGRWAMWEGQVGTLDYSPTSTPMYSKLLVPNVDNVRLEYLIKLISNQQYGVLLIGESGTAKTVMINNFANNSNSDKVIFKTLNFTSVTTPAIFQRAIESFLEKRVGTMYGPPKGRRMIVFIDDINLPKVNEWGDQIANEIVRQTIESSGFYNLDKPGEFTTITDLQFIGAMSHPGGGRNDIPNRLKRQFCIFNSTIPSSASIDRIFSTIALGHFCTTRDFSNPVIQLVQDLVPLTRKLWNRTKDKMKPTPAKFHYVFNLRDLSRIWQGMINAKAEVICEPTVLVKLWIHECSRVLSDRFINSEDLEWFQKTLYYIFEDDNLVSYKYLLDPKNREYFVDFLRQIPEDEHNEDSQDTEIEVPRIYEPIPDMEAFRSLLIQRNELYNESIRGSKINLVFFTDAIIHLIKISRLLRMERGHILLVGVGGSGKRSLTRLSAFICDCECFQIIITRIYNFMNFIEDLRYVYKRAGKDGKKIVFLFTDAETKHNYFLECINSMLSSGMIPGLFCKEDMEEITSSLSYTMKKEQPKVNQTQEQLINYFYDRIRQNLHIVLAFSPVGDTFRHSSLHFPALISGCTISWFHKWPLEALKAVASFHLKSFPLVCEPETRENMVSVMALIHENVVNSCHRYWEQYRRSVQVTQKTYLSYIELYKKLYMQTEQEIRMMADRMRHGLQKLKEAQDQIVELRKELKIKNEKLHAAGEEASHVLENVTKETSAALLVKDKVQRVKERCEGMVERINHDYKMADEKLTLAKPALQEAEDALNTIRPADIITVRKLPKPPHLIQRIMDCVLLLFQKRINPVQPDFERKTIKTSWVESLKLLASTKFLDNLLQFPRAILNEETMDLLEPYLSMRDYNLQAARKSCGSVAGLCSWTQAMCKYFWVSKEVIPLVDALRAQELILQKAKSDLEVAENLLTEKELILAAAKDMYDAAIQRRMILENDAALCSAKMNTANSLMDGLKDEKARWTKQSTEFETQLQLLVGDILLLSGFVSYCGTFNQKFRETMNSSWVNLISKYHIPCSPNVNVLDNLSNPNKIDEWTLQGLPNDRLSIENAIILTESIRYPLLIDPQSQGKNWVVTKDGSRIKTVSLKNKYFEQILEDALANGDALIIEDIIDQLDPALDNILEKDFIKMGSGFKVKVGDKEVDVDKNFQLYITTKLSNPVFNPEIYAKMAIIDFSVTRNGLEDQLLSIVIHIEKEELEELRQNLLLETNADKRQVKELEDNLLQRLANTEGSLVDDSNLLLVLTKTKQTTTNISQKIMQSLETEREINLAREDYRPISSRGSLLYFLISDLARINPMYQTGLKQYLALFVSSIHNADPSPVHGRRINNIVRKLTSLVWAFVVRSLFKEDRITFTLMTALNIDLKEGILTTEEFYMFLRAGEAVNLNTVPPKPYKWINNLIWLNITALSYMNAFRAIVEHIMSSERQWKAWLDKEAPEDEIIPCGYSNLDEFRRMLLIRCWCPDRTLIMAKRYINKTLGEYFLEDIPFKIQKLVSESSSHAPLLGLLSLGSDPTTSIDQYARRNHINMTAISMGQSQEVHARRAITKAQQEGSWVLLQNCHLCLNYMEELFHTLIPGVSTGNQASTLNVNPDFRLWITSEVHEKFPVNLLQICIKFTNQPPQGIRANLARSFADLTQDYMDSFVTHHWRIMYYSLSFLHCTVQERRRFGPLGWNIPYEFNHADFSVSNLFLQNHLDSVTFKKSHKISGIDWKCVRYMISEIQYGGRVTDDYDQRLLLVLGRNFFQEDMFQPDFMLNQLEPIVVKTSVDEYRNHIANLSSIDKPGSFGLHANADISYFSKAAHHILHAILSIQPKGNMETPNHNPRDGTNKRDEAKVETREDTVFRQCSEMLDKLPKSLKKRQIDDRLHKMGALQPMNIFLRQELDRIDRVISKVRLTLTDLRLAIEGTVVMNEELQEALDSIYESHIPKVWKRLSWESSTLGFWYTELLDRNIQLCNWLNESRPICFWLTGLFNPQGFLTAVRQEITRAHDGWALDTVVVSSKITKFYSEDFKDQPKEGVYIYGLFLEGAAWDKRHSRLIESKPKVLYDCMPVINIFAIQDIGKKKGPPSELRDKIYMCPLYKKPRRTSEMYIADIEMPCTKTDDHWILRGVALLCDIK